MVLHLRARCASPAQASNTQAAYLIPCFLKPESQSALRVYRKHGCNQMRCMLCKHKSRKKCTCSCANKVPHLGLSACRYQGCIRLQCILCTLAALLTRIPNMVCLHAGIMGATGCNIVVCKHNQPSNAIADLLTSMVCLHAGIMGAAGCSAFCASTTQTRDALAILLTSFLNLRCVHAGTTGATGCSACCASTTQISGAQAILLTSTG